jgi:hypothetical protein
VTTVANELGRPDDGTDPPASSTTNSTWGLKPYSDKAWSGPIHTKPELIEAVQKKLAAFPGVIFNYTQPAEDAVDEAETGLKSALAVKIFGSDLATLEDKAKQVKTFSQSSGHHRDHGGAGVGPAQPDHHAGPRQTGALRIERERRQHRSSGPPWAGRPPPR